MAEGYLKSENLSGLNVKSRGLAANGESASKNSVTAMIEIGIDISSHISAEISFEDVQSADKIICLSDSHLQYLKACGVPDGKLSVLGSGISDPFGGDINVYRACRDEIISAIDTLIENGFFNEISIVPLEAEHIKPIAELERHCFSEPWSESAIAESLAHGTYFFTALINGNFAGYIGISAIADEGYITNVAVNSRHRRKGFAAALIKRVFALAEEKKLAFVSLEVRASNTAAISLYEKLNFKQEGLRKNFYRNPREDALIMTKRFEPQNENTCD